jgi:transposase-like protein
MVKQRVAPQSLTEAVVYFSDLDVAFDFIVKLRWPNGVVCPHCGECKPTLIRTRRIFKCQKLRKQFSVKVGTVFEDSPLGFDKWLPALWMLANCRNGISSYELARTLKVTQKTAWFMLGRIREAMKAQSFERTQATIEIDEAYIGGTLANMHRSKRERITGPAKRRRGGFAHMTGVIAAVKRGDENQPSQVKAYVLASPGARPHDRLARETALPGSKVYTDSATLHKGALRDYVREMVDHSAKEYVRGEVHTNSVENFWSVFKRGLKGTYISVDPFHIFRYLDEAVFRYNIRGKSELERFASAARDIIGKRLTYRDLIGADLKPATT